MWENPDTDQLLEFGEAGLLEDFMWQSVKLMDVLPKKNDKKVWKSIALFLQAIMRCCQQVEGSTCGLRGLRSFKPRIAIVSAF